MQCLYALFSGNLLTAVLGAAVSQPSSDCQSVTAERGKPLVLNGCYRYPRRWLNKTGGADEEINTGNLVGGVANNWHRYNTAVHAVLCSLFGLVRPCSQQLTIVTVWKMIIKVLTEMYLHG